MPATYLKMIHGTDRNMQSDVCENSVNYIKRKVVSMEHKWIKFTGLLIDLFKRSRKVFR
jgi:hypothetical protein